MVERAQAFIRTWSNRLSRRIEALAEQGPPDDKEFNRDAYGAVLKPVDVREQWRRVFSQGDRAERIRKVLRLAEGIVEQARYKNAYRARQMADDGKELSGKAHFLLITTEANPFAYNSHEDQN